MDKADLKCNLYLRFISINKICQYQYNLIVSGIYYHLFVLLIGIVLRGKEHYQIVNINKILKV
ncbi:hypothetical protein GM31_13875 [Trabulsiella odontotermitis]|uniref:Uncharacterized protein n=1 Tax=Trabulsiella odontotermitis TaxID=379893 RepID=A0A0L0GSN3_9ENTR|nr:hypothetical protein GM30_22360 [Trabulsiella odontotermitis]KNC94578.1 hypothetical protein GM31_13875 [Trabulsiella odontotermitis]